MTSNEASLMEQLRNYIDNCYDNEIATHESFALLFCTKEHFNAFKESDPSEVTAREKVERRPAQPIFTDEKDNSFETPKKPSLPSSDNFVDVDCR